MTRKTLSNRIASGAALLLLAAFSSYTLAGEAVPTAKLVTDDGKTKGDWESAYGADGGEVIGDKSFYPGYAQVIKGGIFNIWNPDSEEDRAPNKKGSDERLAACFYDHHFTFELFLKDGEHRVALYFIDYEGKGRKEKVDILDGRNNAVLVSRSVADFKDGKYLVYDLSGHVKIRITTEGGDNAVISGLFFGKNARNGTRKARVAGEMPTTPGFHKHRFYANVAGRKILVPYICYLPEGFDKNNDKYPVLVHLHGAGEGGTDCNAIFNTGVPGDFRGNEKLRKAIPIVGFWPQTVMDWTPPMTTATIQALDDFLAKMRVDKDRVYCTGYSMGGKGTWFLAEEAAPRFAAIVPMDPFAVQPEVAEKVLKDTSIWIIVGALDGDHTTGSKEMYKRMKAVDADVYLTVVPNCGHGAWGRFMPDPTTYEWMLQHKRGSKVRIPLPPSGVIEDPIEKFKKAALKEPPNNGQEGSILCQFWRGVPGSSVADLTKLDDFPDFPTENYYNTTFATVPNIDDNYGTRMTGYVVPPDTGEYTFFTSSDDASELYLSPDDKEESKQLVAKIDGCVPLNAWDAVPSQKSKKIKLEKGKHYYIEMLHKEGNGDDFVMAGWQLPDGKLEQPIPGNRLIPAQIRKRGPPKPPVAILLDDITQFQKPGMHKLKATIQFERKKMDMSYCLFLPNSYDPNKPGGFPLFTFLHGNSHQGSDWNGLLNEGPPQMLKDDKKLRDAMPMIGLFPQCPGDKRWDDRTAIQSVVALLIEVEKKFNVDKDRVYCTGLSMGGMGTWFVIQEAPFLFAAAAPISAVAVRLEQAPKRLKDVPVWIICGSEDGGFTDGSIKMNEAFKENGNDVKFTKFQGEGHGVWGRFYPTMPFYEWLLEHKRKPRVPPPAAVAVQQPAAVPTPPGTPPAPVAPNSAAVQAPPVAPNVPKSIGPVAAVISPAPATTAAQTNLPVIKPNPAAVVTQPAGTQAPAIATATPLAQVAQISANAPKQDHTPYAQIFLALAALTFVMAFFFVYSGTTSEI